MMKALVTGASGFTGRYLVKHLKEHGYQVRALVRPSSDTKQVQPWVDDFSYADLADAPDLTEACSGIDMVFHVAAAFRDESKPHQYFWDVNVTGTQCLLDAAIAAGVGRFVHCSTVGVQGDIRHPPATEEAPYNPGDHYQSSKVDGEKLVLSYLASGRVNGVIVRPVGIYGPGDTRFLKLFKYIANGRFKMIGSGKVLYQLTYVEDLVEGIRLAAEAKHITHEVFTIGGSGYSTLGELAERISVIVDQPLSRLRIPVTPVWLAGWLCEIICKPFGIAPPIYRRRVDFFVKDRAFSIDKARQHLAYEPKCSLDEGLRRTYASYLEEGLISKP